MSVFYDQLQYSVYLKFSVNQMNEREKLKTELIKKEKKKKKSEQATICSWISHDIKKMPNSSEKLLSVNLFTWV